MKLVYDNNLKKILKEMSNDLGIAIEAYNNIKTTRDVSFKV